MKILLVEDDRMLRKSLERIIKEWDYEVVCAADGAQAWEMFQANPVDLIVSDWMMPTMDGVELCQRIRASDEHPYVYFLILTSRTEREDAIEALECGADDFLRKPVDRQELRARVRSGERIAGLSRDLATHYEQALLADERVRNSERNLKKAMEGMRNTLQRWFADQEKQAGDGESPRDGENACRELKSAMESEIEEWLGILDPIFQRQD
ncbi:MAG: response regulator [Planctomycetales bacterium]